MWSEYLSNNVWRDIGSLKSKVSPYIPLKMFVLHASEIWTKSNDPKYWKVHEIVRFLKKNKQTKKRVFF